MRVQNRYVCEICEEEYGRAEDALACEARGLPEPMSFLPLGERVPAFGEDGVEWAEIVGVCLVNAGRRHEWRVRTKGHVSVSHNLDTADGWVPAWVFDPREGCDAFRYACSPDDLRVWEEAMRNCGFAEGDASEWVRDHVERARARAAEEMARLLED